ncbi:hypothetical protein EPO33_04485 [Patescibacteria group bacterium]|nr:MAG: hypothetical protein EPO33_04485 [Patescibacteria group bacterium]
MDERAITLLQEIRDEIKKLGEQYALAREKQAEGIEVARRGSRTSVRFAVLMGVMILLWLLFSLWR